MTSSPKGLSVADAVAIIIGIVLGAGIFKTPSLVASNAGTEWIFLLLWASGGAISLVGSLCYAELGSTYPHAGGDYHYLYRAYGNAPAFLFAWARMTVIQTGSIAMLAFLIGDYASEVAQLGDYSASYYAAAIIILLTAVNLAGIRQGKQLQRLLIAVYFLGLAILLVAGFSTAPIEAVTGPRETSFPDRVAVGSAMIFVLLTYGGWNEAAYLSAEIRDSRRNMSRALIISIATVTAVYLLVNYVFLRSLGLSGVSESQAVAADLMRRAAGPLGASFISFLIVIASFSTVNAMIITGARTGYALGRDFKTFAFLGRWHQDTETPVNALIAQGMIALILVFVGTGTRSGFVMMVEYTAPVFWLFFLLVGISIMVLRTKEPGLDRPFRVPFYPLTPIFFCAVCAYMFQSSIAYTGKGALLGLGVLIAGLPLLLLRGSDPCKTENPQSQTQGAVHFYRKEKRP
jgi:amino acid transporter